MVGEESLIDRYCVFGASHGALRPIFYSEAPTPLLIQLALFGKTGNSQSCILPLQDLLMLELWVCLRLASHLTGPMRQKGAFKRVWGLPIA